MIEELKSCPARTGWTSQALRPQFLCEGQWSPAGYWLCRQMERACHAATMTPSDRRPTPPNRNEGRATRMTAAMQNGTPASTALCNSSKERPENAEGWFWQDTGMPKVRAVHGQGQGEIRARVARHIAQSLIKRGTRRYAVAYGSEMDFQRNLISAAPV